MIQLRNISLDLGTRHIFQDISCVIKDNDRVGIIGRNGAGKSTLLKLIAGLIKPTLGEMSIQKNTRIAYLPQEEILASTLSVFDEAMSAFAALFETENRIQELELIIATGVYPDEVLEEYAELQMAARTMDRHEAVKQANDVLAGLGFTEAMIQKSVNELSTGWKMRLALAKLLLTDADILLFDEPTNHLDIVTQQWFLEKLQSMERSFLLVSHDRAYLEKACNCILEIERGKGTYYRGNLQAYLQEKEQQLEADRVTRARQEREIEQKKVIVDRFRASAARAQQAKNLLKQIERIELVEIEPPLPTIKFRFPLPQKSGTVVLTCNNLSYAFNGIELFRGVSTEIKRGERVALVAANGVGKTTLINCIIGKYKPLTGTVTFGYNVQTAYFEQEQARALDGKKTILQEVDDASRTSTEAEIRQLLGSFQFSGDDIHKKISVLSGGEKNRVAMIKVLLQKANFLILDEPTNHLDLYAKDVLRQALQAYEGTILFVSHDLDFVSKLATHIIELTQTGAFNYPGTYDEFCAFKEHQHQRNAPHELKKAADSPAAQKSSQTKKASSKEEHVLMRTIDRLEREKVKTFETLATYQYGSKEYAKIMEKVTEIEKKLKEAEREWENLLNTSAK
jgi:ATP-binding cassette subfamily F protein 3